MIFRWKRGGALADSCGRGRAETASPAVFSRTWHRVWNVQVSFEVGLGVVRLIDFAPNHRSAGEFQFLVKPLASSTPCDKWAGFTSSILCSSFFFLSGWPIMGDAPTVNGWHQFALLARTLSECC